MKNDDSGDKTDSALLCVDSGFKKIITFLFHLILICYRLFNQILIELALEVG